MKIALQHIDTLKFYRRQDRWTDDIEEAMIFGSSRDALAVAERERELKGVPVMLHFVDNGSMARWRE